MASAAPSIRRHFSRLRDPRINRRKRHLLTDLITIAICAVICGANNFPQIEAFGKRRRDWLSRFLALPNGIPSHDTFERVFQRLCPDAFQRCFLAWLGQLRTQVGGEHFAIDGKTLRRSGSPANGLGPFHLVSVWATKANLVLGQVAVDEKSNVSSSAYPLQKLNCWTLPSRSSLSWASVFGVSGNRYRPFSRCFLIRIVPLWMRSCSQCAGASNRLAS